MDKHERKKLYREVDKLRTVVAENNIQISAMQFNLEEIIDIVYGNNDIDVTFDVLITHIKEMMKAYCILSYADSDTYNQLEEKYKGVSGE